MVYNLHRCYSILSNNRISLIMSFPGTGWVDICILYVVNDLS